MTPGRRSWKPATCPRAISLPEVLVVIAVIGILAAIGLPIYGNVVGTSRANLATRNLNKLNGAVTAYRQAFNSFTLAADSGTSDEMAVIRALQFRDVMVPGTPFLSPRMGVVESSSPETFRAYWNGQVFDVYGQGTAGTGIDLLSMSDSQTEATFATNYSPLGNP